jgi:hypothetical protein
MNSRKYNYDTLEGTNHKESYFVSYAIHGRALKPSMSAEELIKQEAQAKNRWNETKEYMTAKTQPKFWGVL